jgi:hypothetical protein
MPKLNIDKDAIIKDVLQDIRKQNLDKALERTTKQAVLDLDVYDTGATRDSVTARQTINKNSLRLTNTFGTNYGIYPHDGTSRYPQYGSRKFLALGIRYLLSTLNINTVNVDIGDKEPVFRKPTSNL